LLKINQLDVFWFACLFPRSRKDSTMDLIKLTLVSLAAWMNRQQQDVIDYLQEEVRVLVHGALPLREKSPGLGEPIDRTGWGNE
jgi:hypothetical protein